MTIINLLDWKKTYNMEKFYIPDLGDLVWMDLEPTLGKEQSGRRPVLVITPKLYNQFGLCITIPITSKIKGYNTEVSLPKHFSVEGVILTNHPRPHDWSLRNVKFIEKLDIHTLKTVQIKIKTLLCL
jgi:mRNA interferase MazF